MLDKARSAEEPHHHLNSALLHLRRDADRSEFFHRANVSPRNRLVRSLAQPGHAELLEPGSALFIKELLPQLTVGIGALDPLEFCDQGRLVPLDRFRGAGAFGQETGEVIRVVDHLLAGGAARCKDGQKLLLSRAKSLEERQRV